MATEKPGFLADHFDDIRENLERIRQRENRAAAPNCQHQSGRCQMVMPCVRCPYSPYDTLVG